MASVSSGLSTSCLDPILPKSHSRLVLPITINMQHIFKLRSFGLCVSMYVESSEGGHVRGLYCGLSVVKFMIDGTRGNCVALVGEPLLPV